MSLSLISFIESPLFVSFSSRYASLSLTLTLVYRGCLFNIYLSYLRVRRVPVSLTLLSKPTLVYLLFPLGKMLGEYLINPLSISPISFSLLLPLIHCKRVPV
jgi:hypothetical protein